MRSSLYGPDQLLLASKKPRIIELVKNSRTMTVDEIKALPEKADTISGLLLIKEFGDGKASIAEKIADLMQQRNSNKKPSIVNGIVSIYQYMGLDSVWLKSGRSGSEVELKPVVYFINDSEENQIYFQSVKTTIDLITLKQVLANSQFIKIANYQEFQLLERNRVASLI